MLQTMRFFLTSELYLTGYPPQDLINRSDFQERIDFFKKKLLKITKSKKTILMLNIPQNIMEKFLTFYFY